MQYPIHNKAFSKAMRSLIFLFMSVYTLYIRDIPSSKQFLLFSCLVVSNSCDCMDCSMPGFPVLHHLLELAQTHVRWVGDAIQPSHPLWYLSPPACNISSIRVFSESLLCIRWPNYWSFSFIINPSNEYSGLISFRIDWFDLLAVEGTINSLL